MPTWAPLLPQKLPSEVSVTIVDGRSVFPPDAGPALVTRRFTAVPQVLSFTLPLTVAQAAALETFYTTTCKMGVLEFDWTDCIGSNGLHYFHFVSRPSYEWRRQMRFAAISLRTRPGVVIV